MSQYWSATHILNVVILLMYRKSILVSLKSVGACLKLDWTCFRNNHSQSQKNVSIGGGRKKLGIGVIIFYIQVYWKEKKHTAGRNFTSKKWTVLTFNIIPEKKIPHPLLVIFNIPYCQWVFLMLCLKSIFLLCFKWEERNWANNLVSIMILNLLDIQICLFSSFF